MNPTYGTNLAKSAASQPDLGNSPNGNTADMQHLQNLAAIGFKALNTNNGMNALAGEGQNVAAKEAAARAAAAAEKDRQDKIQAIKDKYAQDMADPANYVKAVSPDGGWSFYKPDGTPISVLEYSQVTGKQVPDVLSGSTSAQDNQFKTDYDKLKLYGAAMSGDETARKTFTDSKEGTAFLANPANKNKTYAEIVTDFKNHYSSYLQPTQLNTMNPTDASGKDMSNSVIGGTGNGMLSDFLNGRRKNVNYL